MSNGSQCSVCGAYVGVKKGQPAPPHQAYGDRARCAGSGQPTV